MHPARYQYCTLWRDVALGQSASHLQQGCSERSTAIGEAGAISPPPPFSPRRQAFAASTHDFQLVRLVLLLLQFSTMRLSHVLPTLLGLASLASLASASGTVVESRTVCHTSYGALRTTYYSTSSTSTTCPVSTVTKTKSGSQAVKTSTVLQTVTVAALPTTVTVTSTVDTTSALTTTSV